MIQVGIPQGAWTFLEDMVDNVVGDGCTEGICAPGVCMEVVILAHKDGLYQGENLIDEECVAWVSTAFQTRGHHVSILWVDEPQACHEWRYPPVVKAAVSACDLLINTSWQMPVEEIADFRDHVEVSHKDDPVRMSAEGKKNWPLRPDKQRDIKDYDSGTWFVRLFPVTAPLLMSKWAQTPSELVANIRHISAEIFTSLDGPAPFVCTDTNGTHLEGEIHVPMTEAGVPNMPYASWRKESSHYLPTPEWVHPPVTCKGVNGELVFNIMLPWWAQYIGISPYWDEPIKITVDNCKMVKFEGGVEAKKLVAFLKELEVKVNNPMIWNMEKFHFGIHPNASVTEYECPHDIYRRTIEHSHTCNMHWHVGEAGGIPGYNFYPHITADHRNCTMTVGGKDFYKNGWLCCLDDPRLKEIEKKYPGRPGIPVNPDTLTLDVK